MSDKRWVPTKVPSVTHGSSPLPTVVPVKTAKFPEAETVAPSVIRIGSGMRVDEVKSMSQALPPGCLTSTPLPTVFKSKSVLLDVPGVRSALRAVVWTVP